MAEKKRLVEEIMKEPGPLWRLSFLVKEVTEDGRAMLYVVGVEADKDVSADHALNVIEIARQMILEQGWVRRTSE